MTGTLEHPDQIRPYTKAEIAVTMVAVMVSLLLAALDSTIVGTAMPKIISDLNGMSEYAWPFTAYMLSSTIAIVLFGKMSDIIGRKPVLLVGISVFLAGSVLSGRSWDMTSLILFRALQGVGGGVCISSAFIVVGGMFPPRERGKYIGILVSMFGLASVIGPAVGGFITDGVGWRWVFYVNIPLGVLAFALVSFGLHHSEKNEQRKKIDALGGIMLVVALLPLLMGFSWAGTDYAWGSPQVIGCFALSVVGGIFFFLAERRAEDPVLKLDYFKQSIFNLSAAGLFLSQAAQFAVILYLPLFLQGVLGTSASASGSITTPMMFSVAIAAILAGQIVSRTGRYKLLLILSFVITVAGMFLLSRMDKDTGQILIVLYSVTIGVGAGLSSPVFNLAVQNAFTQRELATVTSAMQLSRNLGSTIGASAAGALLTSAMASGVKTLNTGNMPAQYLDTLTNPRVLSNPDILNQILSHVPSSFQSLVDHIVGQMRVILSQSLDSVFFLALVISLIGLVSTLFLKEIPLKTAQYGGGAPQEAGVQPTTGAPIA